MAPREQLQRAVRPASPRLRIRYVIALTLAIGAAVAAAMLRPPPYEPPPPPINRSAVTCTPLDAEVRVQRPTMTDRERVVCLAVAGKIERARGIYLTLSPKDQRISLGVVFNLAHPIADAGDDRSAGPIMLFVAEYDPTNYMAVFHAGMAEFAQGHDESARQQLVRFGQLYRHGDVWNARAAKALEDIRHDLPIAQRVARFPH